MIVVYVETEQAVSRTPVGLKSRRCYQHQQCTEKMRLEYLFRRACYITNRDLLALLMKMINAIATCCSDTPLDTHFAYNAIPPLLHNIILGFPFTKRKLAMIQVLVSPMAPSLTLVSRSMMKMKS
jgi:hypothetical protein